MSALCGKIHSYESCGTVDGPGLRFIIFMQGCPLRCQYCHNPDSWNPNEGKNVTVDAAFAEILKYRSYIASSGGGVTVSGGEPLLQPAFVLALFEKCKAEKIHAALDTSGVIFNAKIEALYRLCDLVLLDFKASSPEMYKTVCGGNIETVIKTAEFLAQENIPVWVRHVLVPGLTDSPQHLEKLGEMLATYKNIQQVEILPFHKIGEYKWQELNEPYKLANTRPPSEKTVKNAIDILKSFDLPVR